MPMYHMHAWGLQRTEEGVTLQELELDGHELPRDCWEWNLGPLEEQRVL